MGKAISVVEGRLEVICGGRSAYGSVCLEYPPNSHVTGVLLSLAAFIKPLSGQVTENLYPLSSADSLSFPNYF